MQESPGRLTQLPASYRIALALSSAVLAHTLLLAGLPALPEQPDPAHRVRVELVSPGTAASRPATSPAVSPPADSRNPRFEIPPATPGSRPQRPSAEAPPTSPTRTHGRSAETETTVTERATPAAPPTASAPASTDSAGSRSGAPAQVAERPAPTTQITETPDEQDPYLIRLALHLSEELERLRVPAIRQLTDKVAMEIELQLLGNGALTRARVLKSTGIEGIDDAAYRASLAASPYPEPPADRQDQNRFEVELIFTPSRL